MIPMNLFWLACKVLSWSRMFRKPNAVCQQQRMRSGCAHGTVFEDPLNIRTTLVSIDFSDESFRAFDYASPLTKRLGASVHLVYVYDGLS